MKKETKNNCIFCKIVKKELPCNKIYEDKNFLVFLDIKPVADGHLLIIPKKHVVWMQEVDDKTIADIFKLTKKMMLAMKKGLKCDFIKEVVNGIIVSHFHINLIPRYYNDKLPESSRKNFNKEESQKILKKIITKIK